MANQIPELSTGFKDVTVLCIDNDPDVLSGMVELLATWQCNVLAADSEQSAKEVFFSHKNDIDILLVDYQLGHLADGLSLVACLRASCNHYVPAILITATTEEGIEAKAQKADVGFMRKAS